MSIDGPVNDFARKARSEFNATSGFDGLQVYVSYGHGDEGLDAFYGKRKLPRLQALKKQYDPNRLFVYNEPL
jgi:Berberine and berberine like